MYLKIVRSAKEAVFPPCSNFVSPVAYYNLVISHKKNCVFKSFGSLGEIKIDFNNFFKEKRSNKEYELIVAEGPLSDNLVRNRPLLLKYLGLPLDFSETDLDDIMTLDGCSQAARLCLLNLPNAQRTHDRCLQLALDYKEYIQNRNWNRQHNYSDYLDNSDQFNIWY
jgi:hypothetical protein